MRHNRLQRRAERLTETDELTPEQEIELTCTIIDMDVSMGGFRDVEQLAMLYAKQKQGHMLADPAVLAYARRAIEQAMERDAIMARMTRELAGGRAGA